MTSQKKRPSCAAFFEVVEKKAYVVVSQKLKKGPRARLQKIKEANSSIKMMSINNIVLNIT